MPTAVPTAPFGACSRAVAPALTPPLPCASILVPVVPLLCTFVPPLAPPLLCASIHARVVPLLPSACPLRPPLDACPLAPSSF